MRALAIDTVSEMCSVALGIEGQVITREYHAVNSHSDIVLDMVDEVFCEAQVKITDLDAIICDVGPGSFTGIRIGIGVAQGLAFGADVPMIAVDSLTTLAVYVQAKGDILVAMDARMNQVYWAHYHKREALELVGALNLSKPTEVKKFAQAVYGVGTGFSVYPKQFADRCSVINKVDHHFPLAKMGLKVGQQIPSSSWCVASEIMPIYLRDNVATPAKRNDVKNLF